MINAIAAAADISKAAADRALRCFTDTVTEAMINNNEVVLIGFGTFCSGHRSARTGRNPQTGAVIEIPEARTAKFKAGKALKDKLNGRA